MQKKLKIVFMGSSDFSLYTLKSLYELAMEGFIDLIGAYTKAPKASGRGQQIHKSVIHEFSDYKQIPVFYPKSLRNDAELEAFKELNCDLAIVASYGLIIPQKILDVPPYGFINVHASTLPRWRGAAPIHAAILAGDKTTGITIMKMDAGIDTGDIISINEVEISNKTTHGELEETLGILGAKMISDVVQNLDASLKGAQKQPEEGCYAKKIEKNDNFINFNDTSENLLRKIFAFAPKPGAFGIVNGLRIKIFDAEICEFSNDKNIGYIDEGMVVKCKDAFLKILKLQPAGKKIMNAEDFLRGNNIVGSSFSSNL